MNMHNTMKRIIDRGGYDAADVKTKLNGFFAFDFLTETQYTELMNCVIQGEGV